MRVEIIRHGSANFSGALPTQFGGPLQHLNWFGDAWHELPKSHQCGLCNFHWNFDHGGECLAFCSVSFQHIRLKDKTHKPLRFRPLNHLMGNQHLDKPPRSVASRALIGCAGFWDQILQKRTSTEHSRLPIWSTSSSKCCKGKSSVKWIWIQSIRFGDVFTRHHHSFDRFWKSLAT